MMILAGYQLAPENRNNPTDVKKGKIKLALSSAAPIEDCGDNKGMSMWSNEDIKTSCGDDVCDEYHVELYLDNVSSPNKEQLS
jgi:hypothetical protein